MARIDKPGNIKSGWVKTQMNLKRILCVVLAVSLILPSLSGCVKNPKEKDGGVTAGPTDFASNAEGAFYQYLTEYQKTADLSGLTARGLPPETPATGSVGKWVWDDEGGKAMPVPPFNPLGSQGLYESTKYRGPTADYYGNKSESTTLRYIENFAETNRKLSGEYWELTLPTDVGDPLPFVVEYAKKLGAEMLETPTDDELAFLLKQADSFVWCKAGVSYGNSIKLEMVRRQVFQVNKEYKVTKDMYSPDGGNNIYSFLLDMPGKKFTQICVGVTDGEARLRVQSEITADTNKTSIDYWADMNADCYQQYVLYDLPQDAGLFDCRIDAYEGHVPGEITICFRETAYDLPGYKPGGNGTLLVRNAPGSKVSVVPQSFVTLYDLAADYPRGPCRADCGDYRGRVCRHGQHGEEGLLRARQRQNPQRKTGAGRKAQNHQREQFDLQRCDHL